MADSEQPVRKAAARGRARADAATPFDDVDVDADVGRDGKAPGGTALTKGESGDINRQVAEIIAANRNRGPGEQVSVSPEDVN